jgi:succinate dehydrogenase/fumarate reductase flavoprotein subunit
LMAGICLLNPIPEPYSVESQAQQKAGEERKNEMELSRRDVFKGSALLAAGALGASVLAGCSSGGAEGAGGDSTNTWDREADIVIVGAGMGGICAGIQALENGVQNVLIVEISRWVGGSTSFAFGTVHAGSAGRTIETYDAFTQYTSAQNGLGAKSVVETGDLQTWLVDELGLPLKITDAGQTSAAEANSHGHDNSAPRAHMITEEGEEGPQAPINFFRKAQTLYEERGGQLLIETQVKKVLQDDNGVIIGVLCADKAGNPLRIGSSQVILACGGFQNDEELKQKYLGGADSYMSACMGTPYHTGSGMKMAIECGASLQGDMAGHAGEWLCAYPAKNWMEDVEAWETMDYSDDPKGGKWWLFSTIVDNIAADCILVNIDGKRFCDELGTGHVFERFMDEQRLATAHMIGDSVIWEQFLSLGTRDSTVDMREKLDILTSDEVGGKYYTGATLEELADNMNASGIATHKIHKANFIRTMNEFNAAAVAGTAADLEVPKAAHVAVPMMTPPYYALPIRNAIFVCFGGVAINDSAQVLDKSRKPIPGLYATCPTAGGFMYDFYCGSISTAGVSGRWAANSAAAALGLAS